MRHADRANRSATAVAVGFAAPATMSWQDGGRNDVARRPARPRESDLFAHGSTRTFRLKTRRHAANCDKSEFIDKLRLRPLGHVYCAFSEKLCLQQYVLRHDIKRRFRIAAHAVGFKVIVPSVLREHAQICVAHVG